MQNHYFVITKLASRFVKDFQTGPRCYIAVEWPKHRIKGQNPSLQNFIIENIVEMYVVGLDAVGLDGLGQL